LRQIFKKAKESNSGVQGLLALASECLQCVDPVKLLHRLQTLDPQEASLLFKDIRDFDMTDEESRLLVFLSGGFPYEIQLLYNLLGLSNNIEAQREAFDILDSWSSANPDFPHVAMIYPIDAIAPTKVRSNSARSPASTHKSTAILIGSLASAALYSANKALRN